MIESLSSVAESTARRCLVIAHVIGWGAFALGLSVLAGWLFDLGILKSIIPGALGMKCNTAVCLLFGGLALSLDRPDSDRVAGNARTLLAGTVATIAFLTLFEYLSGHDLGIDQFLFRDPLSDSYPGRMSPATALAFAGFSLALLIRDRGDDGLILFQSLLLVPLVLGAFNLISYVLGLPALFRWGSGLTTMAIPTAAAFVALSVGVALTRPKLGIVAVVASKRMGGTFARRALPIALLFPVLISWLRIKGELFGWYETQFGFLIVALSAVSIFSALILLSARRLNRHDEQLQRSNALLETNISERTAELELRVAQLREEIVLREAAEGARTQSEMRFHQAMEFAPIGMAIVSLEGRWIEVNRAVCDLVGYSRDALMNLTFQDITHPEDLDADLANVRQLLDGKIQTYQMEKRYFHKDGRLVWVLLSVSLVRSAKGDPLHFIAQIQDVTGRKEAEKQRAESEARFRSLTALSADWYWEQDENFRFTLQSGGALGAVGISDQDALGKTRWELPYDNMTEADWNQHRVILDAHKPFHDLQLVRELAVGKKRYVSISGQPMLDEGGRFTGYRGIGRDISARRIAEIELENSKRFLSEVIDAIPVPLTVKDENRRLLIVNSANTRFHGCAAADFIGKLDTDLFPPDRARQNEAEDDAVLLTGEPMIEEQAFETVSGELRWIIKHKRRITLSDGRHWLIATLLDITKRRETEAALVERESWLRLVTDTSAACVGYIDSEQRFRFCNRTYLEWYGIEPADLLGKSIAEVIGEQYPQVQSHYRQVLLGQRASYERKLRRDGGERDIFVDLIPDIRDHGLVAGAFIYSSDITARVRGEQAVRESEELLRRTEQIARIGGWSLDIATATLTWSDEVYRIHELDPAQKPRIQNVLEFYAPETRAAIDQAVQLGIDQGIPWDLELPFVTARGRTIWVRAQGSAQLLDGKTIKLYGTFQDITERKLAELALERSQTFLHAVVEGVPQPLFVKDSQHRWVLFNKAFCDLVEKQGSDLLGHTDADVFPADHVRRVWAEDDEVLDGSGSLSVVETPVVRTDGVNRWLLKSKKRVELTDGSTYIVGVSTDITTLKNTQEAYRRSEELHRLLAENSSDMISLLAPQGNLEYVSPACIAVLGYSTAELTGRVITDLIHPDDREATARMFAQVVKKGGSDLVTCRLKKSSGAWVWVETAFRAIRDAGSDRTRQVISVSRNVDERVRVTEALNRFKHVLDSTLDMIFIYDANTLRFNYVNEGAIRNLGFPREKLLGMAPWEIRSASTEVAYRKLVEPFLLGEVQSKQFETVHRRADGTEFPVDVTMQLVRHAGEVGNFISVIRDATERKKVDRLKNEFVSTVSHELRTPLTSIRGALGLIMGGVAGRLPKKTKELISIAHNNSERLVRLVSDILDVEKMESGRMEYRITRQPLAPLLVRAIGENRAYGETLDVGFELSGTLPEVDVNMDGDRIRQVVANLLSNAAKFSPVGGTVSVGATLNGDMVRVSVSDHGPGIPDAFRDKIFQKFSQADSSNTRQKSGTGLGLSIAKAIVDIHGGSIGFFSLTGAGTTFHFDLPVVRENALT